MVGKGAGQHRLYLHIQMVCGVKNIENKYRPSP
jgi:hypothetical protein